MIDVNKINDDMVYISLRDGKAMRLRRRGCVLSCKEIGKHPTAMLTGDAASLRSATMREQRDYWRRLAYALMDEMDDAE